MPLLWGAYDQSLRLILDSEGSQRIHRRAEEGGDGVEIDKIVFELNLYFGMLNKYGKHGRRGEGESGGLRVL